MKRTILICGLAGGMISGGWFLLSEQILGSGTSLDTRLYLGYATIILGLSLIFVAVKNYRDDYNAGMVTFGKALQIGLLITLIATTVYVAVFMIDFTWFNTDYFDKYKAQVLLEMKAHGATTAAMQAKATEITGYAKLYKNPFLNAFFTAMEIAPVGLVISVIVAFILKKRSIAANA